MDSDFNLVFKGEVALDHDVGATRQKLAKAFNASDEKLAILFSGKPVIVKKGLSSEEGIKLQHRMLQIGAITYLESAQPKTRQAQPVASPLSAHSKQRSAVDRRPVPAVTSLALAPIEEPEQVAHNDEADTPEPTPSKFKFPQFTFHFSLIFPSLLILFSIALLLAFSPYPDYVLRKGFAVGAVVLFIGLRKFKTHAY